MTIYTILEKDLSDGNQSVIGVADSLENVDKIVSEYYGEHKVHSFNDIRDSSLEWIKFIKVDHGIKNDPDPNYKVIVQSFQLNKL